MEDHGRAWEGAQRRAREGERGYPERSREIAGGHSRKVDGRAADVTHRRVVRGRHLQSRSAEIAGDDWRLLTIAGYQVGDHSGRYLRVGAGAVADGLVDPRHLRQVSAAILAELMGDMGRSGGDQRRSGEITPQGRASGSPG